MRDILRMLAVLVTARFADDISRGATKFWNWKFSGSRHVLALIYLPASHLSSFSNDSRTICL